MPNCSVVTCKNRSQSKTYNNSGVTYHIFPKNPSTKEKWIDATGRVPNWFPVQRSVVCSEHFQEKYFQPHNKSRRLFEWAIPTLKICKFFSSMPKVRVRTTTKASWSSDTLEKAVKLIEEDGISIRKAAKATNIPFSSLRTRLNKQSKFSPRLGRLPVFSPEQERELANLIKKMANIFYGCTTNEIRKVAFEYAENLNIKHNFNKSSKMAGSDWLSSFMARNYISVRKPVARSKNRITSFNKTEVQLFYQLLGELMIKHKFVPKNMYNCDETGITTVQPPAKILAAKDQRRVGPTTSWEREKNITLMCAMNAAGGFIPPMLIFPRKRQNPLLEKNGPAGALYKCSDNGWINEQLFFEWLTHFKQHAKPSVHEPVLLVLDNHASHISLSVYEFCKLNHIHILSLPPHTSHKMQPLDVSFFGPLKGAYKKECDLYMKSHPAEKITPYEVASLLRKAFNNVASISKAESGFRATGIYPINPDVFSEEDSLLAELPQLEYTAIQNCDESVEIDNPAPGRGDSSALSTSMQVGSPPPSPPTSSAVDCPASGSSVEILSPAPGAVYSPVPGTSKQVNPAVSRPDIVPKLNKLPQKTHVDNTRQGRKKQYATILTLTPIKENLIEKANKKNKNFQPGKDEGKGNNKTKDKGPGKKTKVLKKDPERVKRKVLQESSDNSVSDVGSDNSCHDDMLDDADDAGNKCYSCNEFGRNNEVSEQDAQPGPSKILDTRTPLDSGGRPQGPLTQVVQQCRFCGEHSKDCVAVSSDMAYLASNKTTLALNDTSLQLDFNDRSLPKTVCRDCDAKLQEFCDFVKVVKAAQSTLINVAEDKDEFETIAEFEETTTDVEEKAEYEETETLIVKTEYDSQLEDSDDDKDGIVDSITIGETVVVKKTHKRKSATDTAKPKKLKTKEKSDNVLVIDIKKEVVEKDANDGHRLSEVSDTGTDVKTSELELATSALLFEMAGDGTSEYKGHRIDR